ncbi:MAG: ComF family protein [Bacteroidetes bacterium]|nr:ComF family protein [bacterium]NBP64841.1 ComF family protein [Bacteroidota bacterium]
MKSNFISKRLKENILDALAPLHCCICSQHIDEDTIIHRICDSCYVTFPLAPSSDVILNTLYRKYSSETYLLQLQSVFEFHNEGLVQKAIHEMKYRHGKRMAFDFGISLQKYIQRLSIDTIVPIPLHSARQRERGFNQSFEIARGVAIGYDLPVSDCIKRTMYTPTQTTLSIQDREVNVSNVFFIKDFNVCRNKDILLIDDVLTTGATLESCASLLLENGARSVSALTIAAARLN